MICWWHCSLSLILWLGQNLKQFNSFHPQIQFTIDQFSNNDIHFLGVKILPNGTTVYRKQTHTRQCQHFSSYTPWSGKIASKRALIHRAHKICCNDELLQKEINNIKRLISWNGYPRRLTRKLISLFSLSTTTDNLNTENVNTDNNPNLKKISIPLPFIGKHGTRLTNSFIRKITPLLKSECKIIINWQTTGAGSSLSVKDPTSKQYKSSIVFEFKCPGCNANYIGKTDRCLYARI